jgi:PAS domain S-box-containing protein
MERFQSQANQQKFDRFKLLIGAVESISDYAIFMLDPEGYILTWNLGAERIKGYQENEVLGKHFSIFYTPEDLARKHPQEELAIANKVGKYEEEAWRVKKDGTRMWANVLITKLTDSNGHILGYSKVTRDLTERKKSEEKLRESEERFRLLVAGVKDYAIYMLDPKGYVSSWNEGAARIKGYEESEILGKHFSIFYPEEDVKSGKCEYELEEATRTGKFEDEGWRIRKDGSMLWANVVISAIRDSHKKLIGFTKVTRDLTEKRRAELKLQRAYADLEKRILERTSELALANNSLKGREKALEEALKVRDEFLSIASHELKTPITSLKLQIQTIQKRLQVGNGEGPSPERLSKSLELSLKQIDRLAQLVGDLLDVTKATAQKLEFQLEPTDLVALTKEVIERLDGQIQEAGCEVIVKADAAVVGSFDRFRLDQVLINLITNALKYAPKQPVHIFINKTDNRAVIAVEDRGPGVPEEMRGRLFERFERAENVRNIGGLGLGLYISKQIIEGHHGTIYAEDSPGHGARFVIKLPLNLVSIH